MDRDAADSNKNQAPHNPTHEFHSTEESEEETVIPDPEIDLGINYEALKEYVQAPKEPPEDPFQTLMTTKEINIHNHPSAVVRISARLRTQTKYYTPIMSGN